MPTISPAHTLHRGVVDHSSHGFAKAPVGSHIHTHTHTHPPAHTASTSETALVAALQRVIGVEQRCVVARARAPPPRTCGTSEHRPAPFPKPRRAPFPNRARAHAGVCRHVQARADTPRGWRNTVGTLLELSGPERAFHRPNVLMYWHMQKERGGVWFHQVRDL